LGKTFVLASRILIHFFSFEIKFWSFIEPGWVKSKFDVNSDFIFWKTGSCWLA